MRPLPRKLAAPTARLFLFLAALLAIAPGAYALDWQAPTPDELKMTSDPSAPGADAVYLYREETSDDKLHMHYLYARIKVLTEKGKRWGDVGIPAYNGRSFTITDVAARTIHPDGTIIPLTGKPLDNLLLREGKDKFKSTVFSLPSVEPGSILEYRRPSRPACQRPIKRDRRFSLDIEQASSEDRPAPSVRFRGRSCLHRVVTGSSFVRCS